MPVPLTVLQIRSIKSFPSGDARVTTPNVYPAFSSARQHQCKRNQ